MDLVVLAVTDKQRDAEPILDEARTFVACHGVEAEYVWECGHVSDTVVSQCKEKGCGMVAMGAFGDSRLREALVGSQTRRVLTRCECPVLMNR
jgi:nucleotide-binding universal stress UspA family protein